MRYLYHERLAPPLSLLTLALGVWLLIMRDFRLDDSFITYQHARNMARGLGLVYNPGDNILSTTAPLYALLLAGLSFVLPDFHLLGSAIGAFSIGAGGILLYTLAWRQWGPFAAWVGAAFYVLGTPLWLALGMETALWLALTLGALWLATRGRWGMAGLIIGLSTLTRPDAALAGALLGLWALGEAVSAQGTTAHPWRGVMRYTLGGVLPLLPFSGWATVTYGSPLPVTLSAKEAQTALGINGVGPFVTYLEGFGILVGALVAQSPVWALTGLVALIGLRGVRRSDWALFLVIWGATHITAYTLMDVAPYRWYYVPIYPGFAALIILGVSQLWQRRRELALVTSMGLMVAPVLSFTYIAQVMRAGPAGAPGPLALPVVDWDTYQAVGDWLNANTPPGATVGVGEVGQVGFYADRWMTDYLGLLQPDVAEALSRRDVYRWLPQYAPDYLVFQTFGRPLVLYNYVIEQDPWFNANYVQVASFSDARYPASPVNIYQRVTTLRPWVEETPAVDYGPLRLVGVATDGRDMAPGETLAVRVRLDWEITGPLPEMLRITLAAEGAAGAATRDTIYDTRDWAGRPFSTYHPLVLAEATLSGGYPLLLTVGPGSDDPVADQAMAWHSQFVGWLDVSFPKGEPAPILVQFGDTIGLLAAGGSLSGTQLIFEATWMVLESPDEDYSYFLHVADTSGMPIVQADGRPRGGRYPTHLWDKGERIPDRIAIDLSPLPPGDYDLLFGWYRAPDGPRLAMPDGRDSYRLGSVRITAAGRYHLTQRSGRHSIRDSGTP